MIKTDKKSMRGDVVECGLCHGTGKCKPPIEWIKLHPEDDIEEECPYCFGTGETIDDTPDGYVAPDDVSVCPKRNFAVVAMAVQALIFTTVAYFWEKVLSFFWNKNKNKPQNTLAEVKLGGVYKHYINNHINNHLYTVVGFCKMQQDGIWIEAVLYENEKKELFVRSKLEFITKFSK